MKNSFDEKILEEAHDWVKTNQKVILATVIQTWGSSPRQVGSRMIVNEKGDLIGVISEADCMKEVSESRYFNLPILDKSVSKRYEVVGRRVGR